jgi:hypothetical protein
MGSSPDVGGSRGMGRPETLQHHELEQTAQTQVLKAGVGLVKTTIDVPIHQIGVGEEKYKYQAESSKPNLQTKVLVAVTRPDNPRTDPREGEEFQRLVDEMPLQLSLELQEDRKKPEQERNTKFIVFELILKFVAKALVWLEDVSQIDSTEHSMNNAKMQAFSHAVLRGWIEVAKQITANLQTSAAPLLNTPQGKRDARTNAQILMQFTAWSKAVLKAKPKSRKKVLKKVKKDLLHIQHQIETKKIQGVFDVTESLIKNLIDLIGTFENEKSSAILITIMRTQKPPLGSVAADPVLKLLTDHPDLDGIQTIFLPRLMKFAAQIFPMLTFAASGKRTLDTKRDRRLKHEYVQSLALRLAAALISHAEVIPLAANRLFQAIGVEGDVKKLMAALTDALTMSILPVSAAEKAGPLMNGVKRKLGERLALLRKEAADKEIAASIRQADIALKRDENISGYFEAMQRMLGKEKIKFIDLQSECREIARLTLALLGAFYDTRGQKDFASMMSQAA